MTTVQARIGAEETWPADGLTPVSACPVCGGTVRAVLHDGLVDAVFFCAPGKWRMVRCCDCGAGYLDPRPSDETLPLAYRDYYTHAPAPGSDAPIRGGLNILPRLRAAYLRHAYGVGGAGGAVPGAGLIARLPRLARNIDRRHAYLKGVPGRLLDVGFGGGQFLDRMKGLGWQVAGVDFDARCVANARARGLDVFEGGLDDAPFAPGSFDAVTSFHSIEHLPTPPRAMRAAFQLLRPGGRLYVETPNLDAFAHLRFGPYWRGLEPPRHLVVFDQASLRLVLERAGFTQITFHSCPAQWVWATSAEIEARSGGTRDFSATKANKMPLRLKLANVFSNKHHEFLSVTARRPE